MSEHISIHQNSENNIPSDCPVCATRPALYLSYVNVFQARFFCRHSEPPSRPHFETSNFFKIITITLNLILIFGIYHDIIHISGKFTPKHVILYLEIVFNATTIIFNFVFVLKHETKLRESQGLIELINNKFKFGVYTILPANAAKFLYRLCLFLVLVFVSEELVMFNAIFAFENMDNELFVRLFILQVIILSLGGLGFFAIQMFFLYDRLFKRCYYEIEKFLSRQLVSAEVSQISGRVFINRLQKLQRLYMCLRRNFKVNEELLQPTVILVFTVYVCLLLIGYGYFATTFVMGHVGMLKFDLFILAKSLGLALWFCYLCYEAQMISMMNEKIVSYLFKYPVSKLNPIESAQVETLISTLTLLKPEMRASDIVTLGTGLLVSMSGTVVTYVLVALQFDALLSHK
ncbi:hypothetical protein Zmor_007485 [Zophobas morio]|uniref:Gustatory receptor n=1 Tax=Zophobas morio TaxID=2755281 RepID=A0AA38J255_9CUCU|nr:hypothetical protein Zmor_007485 [Zophobas morio]